MRMQRKSHCEDSFGQDNEFKKNSKPFETYWNFRSNNITPMQFDKNGNTLSFDRRENIEQSNRSHNLQGSNFYDLYLKNTMNKLEVTESKNNYLQMQRKFVKKALVSLSNKLWDKEEENQETNRSPFNSKVKKTVNCNNIE